MSEQNPYDDVDTLELKDRYNKLVSEYLDLCEKLHPFMQKFGVVRKELAMITQEFEKRNINVELSESEEKTVKELLELFDDSENKS